MLKVWASMHYSKFKHEFRHQCTYTIYTHIPHVEETDNINQSWNADFKLVYKLMRKLLQILPRLFESSTHTLPHCPSLSCCHLKACSAQDWMEAALKFRLGAGMRSKPYTQHKIQNKFKLISSINMQGNTARLLH